MDCCFDSLQQQSKTPTIIDCKFNATSLIQSSCNAFFLEPIVEEVVNYIRVMNPSKSTGRNGIPAKYINMSGSVIAPVLTSIFNACISTGHFRKVLKTAEVGPIFKQGRKKLCYNYRPISILNPFAKLFERCLLDQPNKYFVSNNLTSPNQKRWSPQGRPWPRGHILKSLASKPQVLENCPVLGTRTALFLNR